MRKLLLGLFLTVSMTVVARAQVSFDFSTGSHGWSGTGDWEYADGVWRTMGSEVSLVTYFTSPTLLVATAGEVVVNTSHWYSFEPGYDGGRFEFTTDGGATWNVVANNLFTQNSYSGTVALGEWSQQIGGAVFTDSVEPYGFHTSVLSLGTGGSENDYMTGGSSLYFDAGTPIQFRFLASWGDDTASGGYNWQVENIEFSNTTLAAAIPEPSTYALAVGSLALIAVAVRRRQVRHAT